MTDLATTAFLWFAAVACPTGLGLALWVGVVLAHDEVEAWRKDHRGPPVARRPLGATLAERVDHVRVIVPPATALPHMGPGTPIPGLAA